MGEWYVDAVVRVPLENGTAAETLVPGVDPESVPPSLYVGLAGGGWRRSPRCSATCNPPRLLVDHSPSMEKFILIRVPG